MYSKPIFINKPNDRISVRYQTQNNIQYIDYWISRSMAVDGLIIIKHKNSLYCLIVKRSKKMKDEPLKYCIPCGYLDFNETLFDAMIREVYEETGFYINNYQNCIINDNQKPFIIKDDPKYFKQNVSFIYLTLMDFDKYNYELPLYVQDHDTWEIEYAEWMKISDLYKNNFMNNQFAFNMEETIKKAVDYITDNKIFDEKRD